MTTELMTTELWMLLNSTILFMVLLAMQSVIAITSGISIKSLVGDRNDIPAAEGLRGQANRTVNNYIESLVMFAPLIIIAHLAGISNNLTVMGATIFFWTRVAFIPLYLFGIPWVRTVVFFVGLIGLAMIIAAIFGLGG